MYTGDGSGADGQCVTVGANSLGSRMAEDGVEEGVSLCFDEYSSNGDHGVSIFYNSEVVQEWLGDCANREACEPVSFFEDSLWHDVVLTIMPAGGIVTFSLTHGGPNAVPYERSAQILTDYALPAAAYIGFTARTGGATNNHWVRAISIELAGTARTLTLSEGAVNHAGDMYTGCNWQSVDLFKFALSGPTVVVGVDALDAGGIGAMIATVRIDGDQSQEIPTSSDRWKCWEGGGHGGDDATDWSQVSDTWRGMDGPNGWELPGFDDSSWERASSHGANGASPWGDVNRDMGMDSMGNISAASEWIWTSDENLHNDIFCRLEVSCGSPPPPAPRCTGSVDIAVDNAYVLYLNGHAQSSGHTNFNVAGCEQTGVSGGGAVNHAGDHYTGCNWQSVDRITFDQDGPLVIGVDALDAGGIGGFAATVRLDDGTEYPSSPRHWKCWEGGGEFHGEGAGSQVDGQWLGVDGPNGWELPGFDDSSWSYASGLGLNGVPPWGDVNREMGMDSQGTISAESEWIWTEDENLHNDIFCRLVICDGQPTPNVRRAGELQG